MKYFFSIFLFFLVLLTGNCHKSNNDNQKKINELIAIYLLLPTVGDQYSKIFYMNPAFLSSSNRDYTLFNEATSTSASSTKKKLLIIHGWQSGDRNITSNPDLLTLKKRLAEDIWKEMLNTEFLGNAIAKQYEIYFYTYLSSDSISKNTTRLKTVMDTVFGNEKSTVAVYAHSMGGLLIRGSLYESTSSPAYIARVLTAGTPYHGSPWASSSFQATKSILGDLASFMSDSNGGKDLAWDNYDNSLSGSSNSYLTTMNSKSGRDSSIFAYYGSLDKNGSGYSGSDSTLLTGCLSLSDTFSPSDCIVPVRSGLGTGISFGKTTNLGNFQHTDINLRNINIRSTIISDLP